MGSRSDPFLLRPIGKSYLWGGNKLRERYGKGYLASPLSETWELSVHPNGLTIVDNGRFKGLTLKEVLSQHPEYLGENYAGKKGFPILVKFIDAEKDLSVQVHPSDEWADIHEDGQNGKTEMWYVLEADEGCELVYGFAVDVDEQLVRDSLENNTIGNILRKVPVKNGDVFFIKPGTVHAIGKGAVIVEVQQNSDVTYRLYDYGRLDKDGKPRKLHIDQAMKVCNFKKSENPRQPMRLLRYEPGLAKETLSRCQYFCVERWLINTQARLEPVTERNDGHSFYALVCVSGSCKLVSGGCCIDLVQGKTVFIPAICSEYALLGKAEILSIHC